MTRIIKVLSFFIGLIAGFLLFGLLHYPLVLLKLSANIPYTLFAAFTGFVLGRWVYKKLCNILLKRQDRETVINSHTLESDIAAKDGSIVFESTKIKK